MGVKLGTWISLLLAGHSGSRDLTLGCTIWNLYGFTLTLFQGWGVGSEVLLEQVQLSFSFQNKFIIFPCGLLVGNNTFSKMCVFKSLTGYTDDGGYESWKALCFNNNKIKGNAELMLVMVDCKEYKTEKCHECTNMGKVKQLNLRWKLYVMSLPEWELRNFRPLDFCWTEYTCRLYQKQSILTGSPISSKAWTSILNASSAPGWLFLSGWTRTACRL